MHGETVGVVGPTGPRVLLKTGGPRTSDVVLAEMDAIAGGRASGIRPGGLEAHAQRQEIMDGEASVVVRWPLVRDHQCVVKPGGVASHHQRVQDGASSGR